MATYSDLNTIRRDVLNTTTEEMPERLVKRAAEMAYNIINRYLFGIYSVPFSPTPGSILDISDLLTKALAYILGAKGQIKEEDDVIEYKIAMEMLQDIYSGKADLPDVTRLATRGGLHTNDGYQPIFDLDDAENAKPDKDYMDDLRDRRRDA